MHKDRRRSLEDLGVKMKSPAGTKTTGNSQCLILDICPVANPVAH